MDPITAAILTAIVARVPNGVNAVAKDAYYGLKTWIAAKWQERHKDEKNKLEKALENVEDDPKEQGYVDALSNQIAKAELANDPKALQFVAALKQELEKMGATGVELIRTTVGGDMHVGEAVAQGYGATGLKMTDSHIEKNLNLDKIGATTSPK